VLAACPTATGDKTPDLMAQDESASPAACEARITLGIDGHVIGNQQRDAVENRSARIKQFAAN
jgi:hypothetical protein